ncbi:MAG: hypothetical protein ABI383_00530 [Acidobacteriaceae bacterium]
MTDQACNPTHADADLILKLYDMRREPVMREARRFMGTEFWPQSADDILLLIRDFGSRHNEFLRQVIGYWEMAASFVNRGVLDKELFLDYGNELVFTYAKFRPYLEAVRAATAPTFLGQTEKLITSSARATQMAETMEKRLAAAPSNHARSPSYFRSGKERALISNILP